MNNPGRFKQTEIGRIPEEWEVVRLEEIIELKNGERPEIDGFGTYPVYGANGIMGRTGSFLVDNDFTIIVGRVGASGEIHLAHGKTWVSDNAIYTENYENHEIHLPFLFYLLTFKDLKRFATKTTHPVITQSFLKNYGVPLPPLAEQQRIAEILSAVDESVEKADEAIDKTQRLKTGLMQELLTKGIGHTEFKDTELGRIPKEWELRRIDDLFIVETGTTPLTKREEYWKDGRINWITPADMNKSDGIVNIDNSERKVTEKALRETSLTLMPRGSMIVSTRAPVGYVALINTSGAFNQGCKGLIAKSSERTITKFYSYFLLSKRSRLQNLSGGSTFRELPKDALASLLVPLPSVLEQRRITEILGTVDDRLELLRKKKEKLERVKMGLMNDLLTGRRRVVV